MPVHVGCGDALWAFPRELRVCGKQVKRDEWGPEGSAGATGVGEQTGSRAGSVGLGRGEGVLAGGTGYTPEGASAA